LGEEERVQYPHLTAWYLSIVATDVTIGSKDLPKEAHKAFKKKGKKEDKKEEKKEEAKVEAKPAAEDDLFGSDDDAPKKEVKKPTVVVKAQKAKPVAKSIVVFDVKVYEQETDLLAVFEKIKTTVVVDGLIWNNEPKILPIAFGMNKLQVGCIIEDAKVSVEDFYEQIEAWEEIQSIDTVSFNKL
jgi:translation elongation factor EF-1beta